LEPARRGRAPDRGAPARREHSDPRRADGTARRGVAPRRARDPGLGRSGAYNRTLTPFGFQSEDRTFWQARDVYLRMSPFVYADSINEPILLTHGEADNNTGTYPINSERLFAAIKGLGGTARLVMLPNESHGYAGRESVLHTLAEMIGWFDRYVKQARPRQAATSSGGF
ncbi:MAG: alpha/beta hydrolase family protein, partial [Gemmatimonadales bacterium]